MTVWLLWKITQDKPRDKVELLGIFANKEVAERASMEHESDDSYCEIEPSTVIGTP